MDNVDLMTEKKKSGVEVLKRQIRKYKKANKYTDKLIEIYSVTDAENATMYRISKDDTQEQIDKVYQLNDELCTFLEQFAKYQMQIIR